MERSLTGLQKIGSITKKSGSS